MEKFFKLKENELQKEMPQITDSDISVKTERCSIKLHRSDCVS